MRTDWIPDDVLEQIADAGDLAAGCTISMLIHADPDLEFVRSWLRAGAPCVDPWDRGATWAARLLGVIE